MAWKTLKAIFEDEGLSGLNSPKTVLREAFSAGLIEDEKEIIMLEAIENNMLEQLNSVEEDIELIFKDLKFQ